MLTSADAETLIVQLQKHAGAHSHTAGKAQFYLRRIVDKPNARFSNCSAADFVEHVRNAVYRDEWEPLATIMGGCW